MKKKQRLFPIILSIAVLLSACGKIDTGGTQSDDTNISSNQDISSSANSSAGTNSTDEIDGTDEQDGQQEKREITINSESSYSDDTRQIRVIGLKSYKKLESRLYKEKAGKNKKYLVLFLEITNKKLDTEYINVNYLSAKVDGKEIQNTVLFNDPEGFQTIFQNIEPEDTLRGFIVWEVPKKWKKIEVQYNGWEDSDGLSINCTFTPDDYLDPPQYS